MTRIHEIIRFFFNNTNSKIVEKGFYQWISNSQDQEEKDQALRNIWDTLDISADESTEKSFEQVMKKISPAKRRSLLYPKLLRIASILLIPILSIALSYTYIKTQEPVQNDIKLVEYFVPHGEIHTIVLSDSSKVQLNSGSIFIYPETFIGDSRDVYLNGEACFTVERNEKVPFIVKTSGLEVTVLGTVFNVSSYANNDISTATLEKGSVSVNIKGAELDPIILIPNEQASYNRYTGEIVKKQIDANNIIAWRDGYLLLKNMTINEITKILERKYDVSISLRSNKHSEDRITVKFVQGEEISDVLEILEKLITNFKYEIDGKNVYIY